MGWTKYGVCPCGYHREAPFGNLFHIHVEVCPKCGTDKDEWDVKTGKSVATGTWWKPWTWGDKFVPLRYQKVMLDI
jgi:hypothetical protein